MIVLSRSVVLMITSVSAREAEMVAGIEPRSTTFKAEALSPTPDFES